MPADSSQPLLTLPPEQMRRLGYQVVDLVVDALAGLRERPPSRRAGPEELAGLLHEPVPRSGGDPEAVLRQAVDEVLGPAMRVDHPRFFAYVPIPSNYVGMLADALASGFGVFAGTWQAASGAAAAELATLRWLRELFGLPATAGGLFIDGGSSANLYGLAAARRAMLDDRLEGAVLYASDQVHSWIGRAAGLLGLQPDQVRLLPSDHEFRLAPDTLAAPAAVLPGRHLRHDQHGQRRPAGRPGRHLPGRGAVVPRRRCLRGPGHPQRRRPPAACRDRAGRLARPGRPQVAVPAAGGGLRAGPRRRPAGVDLLHPPRVPARRRRRRPRGQLHRPRPPAHPRLPGVQAVLSLKVFGLDAFAAAVQHGLDLAGYADALLRRRSGWEVVAPTRLALVSFRFADPSVTPEEQEAVNRRVADAMLVDDLATLSSTVLDGRTTLRLCTVNPRTTREDVEATLARVEELATTA